MARTEVYLDLTAIGRLVKAPVPAARTDVGLDGEISLHHDGSNSVLEVYTWDEGAWESYVPHSVISAEIDADIATHEGLADPHPGYLTPTEHTAIGDGAPHHAEAHTVPSHTGTPGGELGGTWTSPTVDTTHSGSAHHAESHTVASHSDVTSTPGGELGGTWASPTVDSTHSGSAHHAQSHTVPSHTGSPGGELGGTWTSPTVDATHSGSAHHAESHTVASHSDTTGTGAELNELTDGSETTLHSHAGGAVSLAATDNTGASTSSTTEVDVLTVSSLSIPAAHKITITGTFQVTSGGVSGAAGFGFKVNSTTVYAAINVIGIHSSGDTQGSFEVEIPPHDGTYNRGGTTWGTGIDGEGTDFLWGVGINGAQAHLAGTAAFPNATTTSIAIRGKVNNASQTLYFNNIRVYEWAD